MAVPVGAGRVGEAVGACVPGTDVVGVVVGVSEGGAGGTVTHWRVSAATPPQADRARTDIS